MKRFAILGHPVVHSLSPLLHNVAFEALGLSDFHYEFCDTLPEDLEYVMNTFGLGEYDGFSVTIPYKQVVMKYCDFLSDLSLRLGAVNTLTKKNGKIFGDNTDYSGFRKALVENDQVLCFSSQNSGNQKALVLGFGGVAKAVIAVLKDLGFEVMVAVRSLEKIKKMDVSLVLYEDLNADDDWKVIVNTTPVGMDNNEKRKMQNEKQENSMINVVREKGKEEGIKEEKKIIEEKNKGIEETRNKGIENNLLLKDEKWYRKGRIYVDVIYTPKITPFLQKALGSGAKIVTGDRMFLWQAVEQSKIFTSREDIPVELMESTLSKFL